METLEKIDKSLTVCKISTTVQDISEKIFSTYDSLESIECDSDYFKSIDGVLFTADYKTLVRYPPKKNGIDYVIPDSVVNIGSCAFRNCEFLENIILPNSLTRIGEEAFWHCKSLQNIELSNSLIEIGKYAFRYCKSLRKIEFPDSVIEMGDYIFEYCNRLREVVLSSSLTRIPEGLFYNCSKLKEIVLPDSIKHIGKNAFRSCDFLQEVKLPKSIISIGSFAFYGCRSLVEIKLPNSIQCIGEYVFSSCESLEAIECDNVYYQAIDGVLFDRKEKRCLCYPKGKMGRKYTIPNGILIIGEAAFGNCCDLEEIILPESIRILENKAFQDCSKLKSIKLPNQISSIASSAFNGCWDLKGIECDSPLFKSIDGVLFTADFKTLVCYPQGKGCDNYVVPDSVTNIAENAFSSFVSPWTADSCKRITLPKSINEITDTTFKHHESLKWIECDNEHYKSIDGVLFTADCKTLVYYPRGREDSQYIIPDTVTKIENRAFASNSYLRKIIVPKGRMEDFIKMFPEDNEYELAEA